MSIPVAADGDWLCPCGTEPPKKPGHAVPTMTVVSRREPYCPFCGRKFKDEYRRHPAGGPS